MNSHKICLFDVTPSHYRSEIFCLMDKTFNIHFYFGDMMPSIKTMDVNMLQGYQRTLHVMKIGALFWYNGMLSVVRSNYDTCIFDGDYRSLSTWIALVLCKLKKKESFLWTHGFYGSETKAKAFVKKLFFALATGGLLYGDYAKSIMVEKYGIPEQKLWVIHNSLDYEKQKKLRGTLTPSSIFRQHFGNDAPVMIFIGRLTVVKKLDMILIAQRILKERGIITNLVYVGDGSEKNRLEKLSKDFSLSQNVWFYGASYDETTNAELLYNADVCVSPGNIGLTAIHALSYGTPAITHNNFSNQMPEFEAIVKGKTGVFFAFDDVDSLADTIGQWLLSPISREEIRKNCYDVIDNEWNPNYQISILKKALWND